ncbi:ExbD/TolR family protein [Hydrogenobaculum acidophilum]
MANLWEEEHQEKEEIHIVPMIDVMLFLLTFFVLLTINSISLNGKQLSVPASKYTDPLPRVKNVKVYLTKNNLVYVGSNKYPYSLDGLSSYFQNLKNQYKEANNINVYIVPDKNANVQTLVNVMDHIQQAGISNISIVNKQS